MMNQLIDWFDKYLKKAAEPMMRVDLGANGM